MEPPIISVLQGRKFDQIKLIRFGASENMASKKKKTRAAGELLFGYIAFRWTTILNEIGRAIAHFPPDQLDILNAYLSTIDGLIREERLCALEKCPEAGLLIREFADHSPKMTAKEAAALYLQQ